MKKSEKKAILVLILVGVLVIAVILGVTRLLNKDNSSEQNSLNDTSKNETQREMSDADPGRGEFTQTESDGIVVNTSEKLKETKVESGFELSNINYSEKDGHTTFEADITNMTGENQGNFMADIVLIDKEGKEQARIPVAIPEMQIGETVGIQAGINDSYVNAYNFVLEKR